MDEAIPFIPEVYTGLEDRSEELEELSDKDIRIRFYQAMAAVDPDDPDLVAQLCEAIASVMFDLCAIHLYTADGGLALVSAYDVNEVLGARVQELFADDLVGLKLAPRHLAALERIGVTELSDGAQFESRTDPSLRLRAHSLLVSRLQTSRGEPFGTIVTARHATTRPYDDADRALLQWIASHVTMKLETGRLHRDLRAKNQQLQQKAEALGRAVRVRDEFIGAAAHELKTPLSTLALQVEIVRRELAALPLEAAMGLERNVEAMRRQVDRLNRLVGRLLDTTQLTEGELALELREVDLLPLTQEVVERFRPLAEQSGLFLALQATSVIGTWDADRLDQVISNLLSNAIKYSRDGEIRIVVEEQDGLAIIRVSDDGIGVPEQSIERIFNRFERASNAERTAGLGLGLWIANQIVRRLGGTIAVHSGMMGGSTFEVALPLAIDQLSR